MAHWPSYLEQASLFVPRAYESGEIDRRIDTLKVQAVEETASFAAAASQSTPLPGTEELAAMARILERFSHKIPEMIVVGRLLDETLPAGE